VESERESRSTSNGCPRVEIVDLGNSPPSSSPILKRLVSSRAIINPCPASSVRRTTPPSSTATLSSVENVEPEAIARVDDSCE
jgi:hypothetical protein